MEKYELVLDDTKVINKRTLYRIRALRDFSDVKKGDLGGFIEKESNLSHKGMCWVYDNACVYDNAVVSGDAVISDVVHVYGKADVYDNACVYGKAMISGNAKVFRNALLYGDIIMLDDAWILGNAEVSGHAWIGGDAHIASINDYVVISHLNSTSGWTSAFKQKDKSIYIAMDNFHGTLDTFMDFLDKLPDDKHTRILYGIASVIATMLSDE